MASGAVNYFAANVDYLVIGKTLGPELLGAYTLAYELAVAPLKRIGPIIGTVSFPFFARVSEDDAHLRRGLLAVSRVAAAITWPGLALAAAAASVLVPTVFGPGWETTVTLLPPLAIVSGLKLLENPSGAVYLAKDRPDLGFKFNLAIAIWLLITFTLASQADSISLIAWCYAVSILGFVVVSRLILHQLVGLEAREYIRALEAPTLIAGAAAAGAAVVVEALPSGLGGGWITACAISVGAIAALSFAARFTPLLAVEVVSLLAPWRGANRRSRANATDGASTESV